MCGVMSDQRPSVQIQLAGSQAAAGVADRIWPCYEAVFGDFGDAETWRRDMFERHAARAGYRLAVATDGGMVVGFAWGYIGQRGQYWTDLVRGAAEECHRRLGRRTLRVCRAGGLARVPGPTAGLTSARHVAC
jgi:hypothetical protein